MKKDSLLLILELTVSLIVCVSCGYSSNSQVDKQNEQKSEIGLLNKGMNKVGNDSDEHGCIASAGYQWSALLKECIRPFEKGCKMISATDKDSPNVAYIVFNTDSSQIELFLPNEKNRPILQRHPDNKKNWAQSLEEEWLIKHVDDVFYLLKNESLQYVSKNK